MQERTGDPTKLDPLHLMLESSGIVLFVLVVLLVASFAVWVIWLLKSMQLRRLLFEQRRFERKAEGLENASHLISLALEHRGSPGARVVLELAKRHHQRNLTLDL